MFFFASDISNDYLDGYGYAMLFLSNLSYFYFLRTFLHHFLNVTIFISVKHTPKKSESDLENNGDIFSSIAIIL